MDNKQDKSALSRRDFIKAAGITAAGVMASSLWDREAFAQAQQTASSPEVEMYRPTVMPDRIILNWTGDPATTQAVTWRTDTSVKNAVAQIAVADPGPSFKGSDVPASTSELQTKLWSANYHSTRFDGLKPDTPYAYRTGDGVHWSEWLQFRTASDKPKPFSFIYMGDAQVGIRSLWSRVIRQSIKAAPDTTFLVLGGDLVNDGSNDALWGELFGVDDSIYGTTPVIPTVGNHEYLKAGVASAEVTSHWRAQFTLPGNGPKGLEEYAYYTDYQGLRMISLNSNEMLGEQAAWLDEVLSNNPNKWTIITFHHPVFACAKGRGDAKARPIWKPIFDKHKVDLVLNGHDHTYGRTGLEESTVYLTSVSGAKMYELNKQPWMHRAAENTQLFQIININEDKLSLETRTAAGGLYDAFDLLKETGKTNKLVDKIPAEVAERV